MLKIKISALPAFSVLLVSFWATSAVAQSSEAIRQSLLDALMAEQIAIDCPTIKQNGRMGRGLDKLLFEKAREAKLSDDDYVDDVLKLNAQKVYDYGTSFIKKQKIDVDSEASWCEAGHRLISTGDPVGRFLLSR